MGGGLLDGVDHGHDRMRPRHGAGRAVRRNKEMVRGFGYLLSTESRRPHRVAP